MSLFLPSLMASSLLMLTACAPMEGPTSPSGPAAPESLDVKGPKGARDSIDQSYWVFGDREEGYLTGAVLTITTSEGTVTAVASGPHAKVRVPVPPADEFVHIVITYPGFCFEEDVLVQTAKSPGPNGGTVLSATRC